MIYTYVNDLLQSIICTLCAYCTVCTATVHLLEAVCTNVQSDSGQYLPKQFQSNSVDTPENIISSQLDT